MNQTKVENGGPAFPVPFGFIGVHKNTGPNDPIPEKPWINTANGISTWDYFVSHAPPLPEVIRKRYLNSLGTKIPELEKLVYQEIRWQITYANLMMEERKKIFSA